MHRWLRARESSRDAADKLARTMLDHLERAPAPELAAALLAYHIDDGPAWALPPGEWMITRYDWNQHVTVPVAVFPDKPAAEAELDRLKQRKTTRPQHLAIVKRP